VTQGEIIAKLEAATQIEAMARVEGKIGPSTACSTKETPTIEREIAPFLENLKRK
jgi:hypothetical protein